MLKTLIRKLILILILPIRYAVRHELLKLPRHYERKNIGYALDMQATESSADYVRKNMLNVDSARSNLDLLTIAIEKSDLSSLDLICEFGVYNGGTINHIANLTNLNVYGFDSFEGLPESWREGFGKGAFSVSTLPEVKANVVLIKGWFDATLPVFIESHKELVGFLHIDCDLYSSTRTIFDLLETRIRSGCVIVFDEYFNYPGWEEGEFKAFQEFISRTGYSYEYIGYNPMHEQVAVKIIKS